MSADPAIAGPALEIFDIEIGETQGFYRVVLPNGAVAEGSSAHCLGYLHGLMLWDLKQSHAGNPMVHGATVVIDGKRLLIVAGKGTGKSTLALGLMAMGHDVEGDEHLVIGQDGVIARPRSLRIKPHSLEMVGDLPPSVWQSPSYRTPYGMRLYAVSPALFGRPWRITPGPLHSLVFAEANHGGLSIATPMSADEAFRRLMENGYFLEGGIVQMAGRLRRMVAETPAYLLRLGSISSAEWHLKAIAGS